MVANGKSVNFEVLHIGAQYTSTSTAAFKLIRKA
jgi:hypothetical protein